MKTKNLLYAFPLAMGLMFAVPQNVSAQNAEEVTVIEVMDVPDCYNVGKRHYYENRFGDNMYISAFGGGNLIQTEHSGRDQFGWTAGLSVGKWLTPYVGLRVSGQLGELRYKSPFSQDVMERLDYYAFYGDMMWNVSNTFWGYNEHRVFSFIPFVGIGYAYAYNNDKDIKEYGYPITGGLKFNFCLSHYVDMFLEARGTVLTDQINSMVMGTKVDAIFTGTLGVTYKFGKNRFKSYNPQMAACQMNVMNEQVNMLRAALAECVAEECPPCPEMPAAKATPAAPAACSQELTAAVRFTINSAVITNEEMINVYNIAQWMKKNPSCNITVQGYADKATGTKEFNMKLSKERAEAVRDALIKKYNIDSKRIMMKAYGSDAQVYPNDNNWNRVVVFFGSGK